MARKKDNSDLLILGLLALAFLGKGPLSVPSSMDTTPARTGPMDMGSPSRNGSNGDGTPTESGVNDKNAQTTSNKTMGMGGGVVDKGSPMTPPGGSGMISPMFVPPKDNAGVMAAQKTIAVIAGGGAVMEGPGTFLQPNLPTIGGPGASTTTVVFNPKTGKYDTFTNNELLFSNNADTKNTQPMSAKEMAKQPMPAMAAPMMMMPVPLSGLVDTGPKTNTDIYKTLLMQQMMAPVMATPAPAGPAAVLPPVSGTVPNPLPQMPSILSNLQGFGQSFLNQFLQAGQSLTGLFNNLSNVLPAIPGLAGPKPLPIEAV